MLRLGIRTLANIAKRFVVPAQVFVRRRMRETGQVLVKLSSGHVLEQCRATLSLLNEEAKTGNVEVE